MMLNFRELQLDKRIDPNNIDSFIGIRRNKENGKPEFRLPIGFNDFPEEDFNATKQLFFRMYRTFKKFERDNFENFQDIEPRRRDNIEAGGNAYQFKDKEGNEVILYSKINVIERMLEAYQDLALDIIERRMGRNERIDFSKIDRYLHKAIYLDDDVIYIEEMDLVRQTLQHESANIIELFCFILSELQQELEQTVDRRISELANRLREQHLTYDQSLFDEETFDMTLFCLKEILDNIDKTTAYKDDDYWQLYEAIETFLYGELDMENTHEEGIFWGISNFYRVWEDMCNTYAFKTFNDIVYADSNIVIGGERIANRSFGGHRVFCKEGFENPFFIEFRGEKRWMRPDLVRNEYIDIFDKKVYDDFMQILNKDGRSSDRLLVDFTKKDSEGRFSSFSNYPEKELERYKSPSIMSVPKDSVKGSRSSDRILRASKRKKGSEREHYKSSFVKRSCLLLDWKYRSYDLFLSNNSAIQQDITKQLAYEFALQQDYPEYRIKSQFVIPYFYPNNYTLKYEDVGEFIEDKLLIDRLRNNGIQVFKADLIKLQQVYLSE